MNSSWSSVWLRLVKTLVQFIPEDVEVVAIIKRASGECAGEIAGVNSRRAGY
jgi:hypothetical protein